MILIPDKIALVEVGFEESVDITMIVAELHSRSPLTWMLKSILPSS